MSERDVDADLSPVLVADERLEALLRGAVEVSAALVTANDPDAVRVEFLRRLVADMHVAAAVLWCRDAAGAGVELVGEHGLPDDVAATVATLSEAHAASRLAAAGQPPDRPQLGVRAESSWPDHEVLLVPVPEPAEGVLGVYSARPLPPLVDGVLATLAHALAAAVRQATLHHRSVRVLDSLQQQLRPRASDLPATVEVGAVYRSATAGADIGGDFYDWFDVGDGLVGVACGDVAGKGIEAASLTAMAVYTLRAFALQGASPRLVHRMLDAAVTAQTPPERFTTLAYARVDTKRWIGQLALAGQPPPLLVGPAGPRSLDIAPDVPLGLGTGAMFDQVSFDLAPGECLVLYTDGVSEARQAGGGADAQLDVGGLLGIVADLSVVSAQAVAEGIGREVARWTGDDMRDDVCVVVLRRPPA